MRGSVRWGCDEATALDIEVYPQRRSFCRHESDFALQADSPLHVERPPNFLESGTRVKATIVPATTFSRVCMHGAGMKAVGALLSIPKNSSNV